MSPSLDVEELIRGQVRFFPVVPGRMEFAVCLREALLREKPAIVAVELPETLAEVYRRAVERLPELSVILYDDQAEDRAVYLPVEVTDPFVEALRTAKQIGAEAVFLDPDIVERPHVDEHYPDAYAVERIGLARYIRFYRGRKAKPSPLLTTLAEGMAWKLQGLDPEASVFSVVSLNALEPLLKALGQPQARPMRKARRQGVRLLNLDPESLAEVLTDYPFLQAVYEARRADAPPPPPEPASTREVQGFGVIEAPKQDPRLAALARAAAEPLDRQRLQFRLFAEAERQYENRTGESIQPWQRRLWGRYTRNLALSEHQLLAGLFDLTSAARSLVDDNFGWELWEMASAYPAQKRDTDLMTVKVTGEQMWLNTRLIRLRPRRSSTKARRRPLGLKGRKKERYPGEWRPRWTGNTICSYPPEDLVIEDYGQFLKKKGKGILSQERAHTEPFTTSLLDGIDLRETMRNWHEKKIYVRSNQRVAGEVGAVVLIFDDAHDNRYGYSVTWLGEHQNESDMAFYATDPWAKLVGPGIGRGEYGGLLLTLPPQRLMDVWGDPDYAFAESKAETLLLAALDYSVERLVVYVARKPPRSVFRTLAGRIGRKIVYIPIGQVSPVALKKIRVMHVLDGHDRRKAAKDYIW